MSGNENSSNFVQTSDGRWVPVDNNRYPSSDNRNQSPNSIGIRIDRNYPSQTNQFLPIIAEENFDIPDRELRAQTQSNQQSGQSNGNQSSVSRTVTRSRKVTNPVQKTELSNFKVDNFQTLNEKNLDLKSAKIIPIDDISEEEAKVYHGEVKTINVQPVNAPIPVMIKKNIMVDQSVMVSERSLEPVKQEEEIIIQERRPTANKVIVKDVVNKSQPHIQTQVQMEDKGMGWKTCFAILAALLFIIAIAALLRYFLFVPIVPVAVPQTAVATVTATASASANAVAVANTKVIEHQNIPHITHIEQTKIRHKKLGSGKTTQKQVTHTVNNNGVISHVVSTSPVNTVVSNNLTSVPVVAHDPIPTNLEGPLIMENKYYVVQPQPQPFIGYTPDLIQQNIPIQEESQFIQNQMVFDNGISPQNDMSNNILINNSVGPYQQEVQFSYMNDQNQSQINPNAIIQNDNNSFLYQNPPQANFDQQFNLDFNNNQPSQVEVISNPRSKVESKSENTIGDQVNSFLAKSGFSQNTNSQNGSIQIELDLEPKNKPIGSNKNSNIEIITSSSKPEPSTFTSTSKNKIKNHFQLLSKKTRQRIQIPQKIILPDKTVYHNIYKFSPIKRTLRQNSINQKIRREFEELSDNAKTGPKSANEILNSIVTGEESNKPYRHMRDFMNFSAPEDDKRSTNDFTITYHFKNSGDAARPIKTIGRVQKRKNMEWKTSTNSSGEDHFKMNTLK